ncbi:MAG: hypothetical protein GXP62_02440, partial [Oligoflexia bacterium]|nr:hypothetical protein [Oligoflexia bacterium]
MADPVSPALLDALERIEGVFVRTNEPMAAHIPLRCGGPAEVWAIVEDEAALRLALAAARKAGQRWWICWPFHEVLVRDGGVRGLVLRPGRGFEGAVLLPPDDQGPARLRLGSATPWAAARVALD